MKKRLQNMILAVAVMMVCLLPWIKMPVYAADMEFAECSKLMQATAQVEALERPDENAAVLTAFEKGAPMLVTGESEEGWYRITFQGKDGYVKADSVETAMQVTGESLENLDRELNEMEQTNKIIVEEVERMRTERERSRIWTVVIILLVVSIFGVGIYSTVKANREEKDVKSKKQDKDIPSKETEFSDIAAKKAKIEETNLNIIDLDTTDIDDMES